MSLRAHRIVKIETAEVAFNLSHDSEVMDLLARDLYGLDIDGGGLTCINQDTIERALAKAKEKSSKDILFKMLEDAIANSGGATGGYVEYYCY